MMTAHDPLRESGGSGAVGSVESITPSPVAAANALDAEILAELVDFVLAGVDGSAAADCAARWAADEATRRGVALWLVFVQQNAPRSAPDNPQPTSTPAQDGRAVLARTAALLRADHPQLPIETKLIDGDPATVLRDVSVDALHAVVGTRGASRLRLVWGSVAAELAETCPVPLAVIHSGRRSRSGPVVVGVDGTATSWPAIDYAFESAAARQTSLTAVHCWTNHSVGGCEPANGAGISSSSRRQVEGRQAARLTEELRRWAGRYPTVLVEKSIVHGQPGTELLHYATSAQLIVAGRRGSPGRSGMLLGSTGLTLIAHSRCPVVIVRAPAG